MGIIKKQGIQSSVLIYAGFILGAFNILFLFPHFFSEEELGLTRVLFSAAITFAQLCLLGIPATMIKFFPFYKDYTAKKNDMLFLSLIGASIGFIVVLILTYYFHSDLIAYYSKKSPLFSDYFSLVYVFGFLYLLFTILETFSRTHYKNVLPIFLRELGLRIYTSIIIVLYILNWINIQTFIYLFCTYHLLASLIMVFYLLKRSLLHMTSKISHVSKRLKKRIFTYGAFIYSGGLFTIIAENVDTFLIAGISGLKSTAIFSIASYVATVIEIPKRGFSNVVTPVLSHSWKNRDMENIKKIYEKTALNQLIAGIGLFLLIWLNVDSLFSFLPPAYAEGKYVILILCIAKLIDLGTGANGEIIVTSDSWKFNFITNSCLVASSIPMNFFFITKYGIIGSAYSNLIVFSTFNFIRFVFIYHKFKLQPYTYKTLLVLFMGAITVLLVSFMPSFNNIVIDVLIRSTLVICLFGIPLFIFKISEDINKLIHQAMAKIGIKKSYKS